MDYSHLQTGTTVRRLGKQSYIRADNLEGMCPPQVRMSGEFSERAGGGIYNYRPTALVPLCPAQHIYACDALETQVCYLCFGVIHKEMTQQSFLPQDFIWGFATASAQIEGGSEAEERASRGVSVRVVRLRSDLQNDKNEQIWDKFCEIPGNIEDGTSTFRTTDHFARWKEDVACERKLYYADGSVAKRLVMKSLGVQSYRFSLSWPRIVPGGSKGGEVNAEGVEFYSELIDELLRNDILPFVVSDPGEIEEKTDS